MRWILTILFAAQLLAQNGAQVYPAAAGGGTSCTGAASIGFVATATAAGTSPSCSWQSAGGASVTEAAVANSEYVAVSGTNTLTGSTTTTYGAISAGFLVRVLIANTNSGAVTFAVNGLTAAAVTKNGSAALVGGELVAGHVYVLLYDGTRFQVLTPTLLAADVPTPISAVTSMGLTLSGSVTATDGGTTQIFTGTQTGPITSFALSGWRVGYYTVKITEGGSGGYGFTGATNVSGVPVWIAGAAGAVNTFFCYYDGTACNVLQGVNTSGYAGTPTGTAPTSAPSTGQYCWVDPTDITFHCANPSTVFTTNVPTDKLPTYTLGIANPGDSKWVSYIDIHGTQQRTQPASTNLSDSANLVRTTGAATLGAFLYDFSASTFKIPVIAGGTTTANNHHLIDSTNSNVHFWDGAGDFIAGLMSGAFTSGNCLKSSKVSNTLKIVDAGACGGGSGYSTIQANGTGQTARSILNLKSGTNFTITCVDNSGAGSTDCTGAASAGAGGYSQAQNAGSNVTQQTTINFKAGLQAVNNGGTSATDVSLASTAVQTNQANTYTVGPQDFTAAVQKYDAGAPQTSQTDVASSATLTTEQGFATAFTMAAASTANTVDGVHKSLNLIVGKDIVGTGSGTITRRVRACPAANFSAGVCSAGTSLLWSSTASSMTTAITPDTEGWTITATPTAGTFMVNLSTRPTSGILSQSTIAGQGSQAANCTACTGGSWVIYYTVQFSIAGAGTVQCGSTVTSGAQCVSVEQMICKFDW